MSTSITNSRSDQDYKSKQLSQIKLNYIQTPQPLSRNQIKKTFAFLYTTIITSPVRWKIGKVKHYEEDNSHQDLLCFKCSEQIDRNVKLMPKTPHQNLLCFKFSEEIEIKSLAGNSRKVLLGFKIIWLPPSPIQWPRQNCLRMKWLMPSAEV